MASLRHNASRGSSCCRWRRSAPVPTALLLGLLLGVLQGPGAEAQQPASIGSSITGENSYSHSFDVCHGVSSGGQVALSDYDGLVNGGAFQVLVISSYYTGCNPGRDAAPDYGEIAQTLRAEFPGQVAFLTSLKGSSSCSSWGDRYLGDTATSSVSLLADTDSVLHWGLFDDNPQYVIVDKAMVLRERFESSSLNVNSVRASVTTYLAEADPPPHVDCVGSWSTCAADCGAKTYTVTTAQSGSGNACAASHGATLACAAGEGDCPPNVD
jgi:hypothetical protein